MKLKDPKILFLTSGHSPFSARLYYKELKSLQKMYANLAIAAPHDTRFQIKDNIKVFGVRKRRSRFDRLETLIDLYRAGLKHSPNIIHCHEPDSLFIALLIKRKLSDVQVIYDCHEFHPYSFTEKLPGFIRIIVHKVVESIENHMASRADAVITVNERLGNRFKACNHRVTVLPNYPPLEVFCRSKRGRDVLSGNRAYMVYAGGLAADRGLFKMVEILSALGSSTECKLILIGNFASKETEIAFWRYVAELNVSAQVEHLGYLSHAETIRHMMRCDIGLCLLMGRQRYHWTEPMKYFEYSAAGLPVILSDLPAMRDLVDTNKNGYAVPLNSIVAASDAIKSFIENRDGAREMGARGRLAFRQKYNWEALDPRLFDLYSSLT